MRKREIHQGKAEWAPRRVLLSPINFDIYSRVPHVTRECLRWTAVHGFKWFVNESLGSALVEEMNSFVREILESLCGRQTSVISSFSTECRLYRRYSPNVKLPLRNRAATMLPEIFVLARFSLTYFKYYHLFAAFRGKRLFAFACNIVDFPRRVPSRFDFPVATVDYSAWLE